MKALDYKPSAFWQLDDTTPFQDYSGYSRSGILSGSETHGVSLSSDAVYSQRLNRDITASFDSPVFKQGAEDQPFTLGASVYPITNTTGHTAQPYRENLITTPSFEGQISVFNYSNAAPTISTDAAVVGTRSAKMTAATTTNMNIQIKVDVIPGKSYSIGGYVRTALAGRNFRLDYAFENSAGVRTYAYTNLVSTTSVANTFVNLAGLTVPAPADTTKIFYVIGIVSPTVGEIIYIDALHIIESTSIQSYFDGSMAGYEWVGTAHNSVSRTRKDVALVNLSTSNAPVTVGSGYTLTQNVSANGKNWARITTSSTASGAARTYVPLGDLQPNARYIASYLIYNDSANDVDVSIDWNDNGSYQEVLPAGQTKRIFSASASKLYDSVYHFLDVGISKSSSVLIAEPTVFLEGFSGPFFNGSTAGAAWAGTPNASSSIMYVSDGEQQIIGNSGQYDGLTINGTVVSFVTKYSNTGECRASYDIGNKKKIDVFGVHTQTKNMLYIDGELVSEENISEYQQQDTYVATGNLVSGQSLTGQGLLINNVAIYPQVLSDNAIKSIYEYNNRTSSDDVGKSFGGETISLSVDKRVPVIDTGFYTDDDWLTGDFTECAVDYDQLVASLTGGYTSGGTWYNSINLQQGLDTVTYTSLYLDWEGSNVNVAYSTDGVAWTDISKNTAFASNVSMLFLRITFVSGQEFAYIENLRLFGYTSNTAVIDGRSIAFPANASMLGDYDAFELNDDWGVKLNGGSLTLTADANLEPVVYELWVKQGSGDTLTTNATITSSWTNGVSSPATPPVGGWALMHFKASSAISTDITLSGDVQIGQIVLYPTDVSSYISNIYISYTGVPTTVVQESETLSVFEPASPAAVYAHDWQILASS